MFGNKEGWLISAIIVALMGWMLWTFGQPEGASKPSGQFVLTDPIRLPVSPEQVLPGVMTEDRDAGDDYWQAIQLYLADSKSYKNLDLPKIAPRAAEMKPIALLLKSTSAKKASLFINRPELLVNYKFPWPELDAAFALGQTVNSIGHYYVVSKTNANEAQAKKYLYAGFSLGAKLYEERIVHAEMMNGIQLMRGAVESLKELAKRKGDSAAVQSLEQFGAQTQAYYITQVRPLYEKVVGANPADVKKYAGDVFVLATSNPDRMWRSEALLKVGRYRFEKGGSLGDQLWANRFLNDPARLGVADATQDKDPAVRTAAIAAKELTAEKFRQIQ